MIETIDAERAYRCAAETDSKQGVRFGVWLQERGRFDESEEVLRRALAADPGLGEAYLALAESARLSMEEPGLVERISTFLADPRTSARDRACMCFAMGKALDRAGDYEEAARYFEKANGLALGMLKSGLPFDPAVTRGYPDKIARIYSKEALAALRSIGSDSETPILIVGMIRSGTTLLDQIVASHPGVSAAGELPFWRIASDRFNRGWYDSGINAIEIERLQKPYLQLLARESEGSPRVTDKMPLNFESLGMIHLAFPKAKILHVRRHPADTCLSVFQNYYGASSSFAYSWDNIIAYYRSYLRFMELWRTILPPGAMFELDYESLVSDPESVVRSVIKFLGLAWDDACLNYQARSGHVKTPSSWQARQPIYRKSVEKWRDYAPWFHHLDTLKDLHHPIPIDRPKQ